MRGFIYNNPALAQEGDGHWGWLDNKPHAYWCVLAIREDHVLLAPIFFDVMDNLPDSVIDSCPYQICDTIHNLTLGIGRCVMRPYEALTTEPVVYLNPQKAKEAYNKMARSLKGE